MTGLGVDLSGRRAFVTAGGGGIGREIVIALRACGAQVATCDVDEAALAELPPDVWRRACDVTDSRALDDVLDTVLAEGLDILVNNAGIAGPTKNVEDVTDEEWRATMAVDIDSYFFTVRRVAPLMKHQRSGAIVNMSSTAGTHGYPTRSPYVAAKWAVVGFTKSLAMELGPSNVRVNAIAPGSVNGPRMERVMAGHAASEGITVEDVRRLYSLGVSMNTFVDADEIASLTCYLVSDHGRHISGQVIALDGNSETLWPRT